MARRASRRYSRNAAGKIHNAKSGRFTRIKRNSKGRFTRKAGRK